MEKLKRHIEAHIQEIVFFISVIVAFSSFLSGVLYLALNTSNLTYILGQFGAMCDQGLFSVFGYAFFYLSVISLHMGYVMNFHIFSFKDFKRQSNVLIASALAHVIILLLFSNLLTIVQLSLELPASKLLAQGAGGYVGHLFSHSMYANVGIYGSLLALISLMGITALVGGFFEIPDVVIAFKAVSNTTKRATSKSLKTVNSSLINGLQFLAKGPEVSEAMASGSAQARNWIGESWNKANHMMTDQFHIYKNDVKSFVKNEEIKKDGKNEKNEKNQHLKVSKKDNKKVEVKVVAREVAVKTEKKSIKPDFQVLKVSEKTVKESKDLKKTANKIAVKAKAKKK